MPVKMGQKMSGGMKTLLGGDSSSMTSYPVSSAGARCGLPSGRPGSSALDSDLERPVRLDLLLARPAADKQHQLKHAWNPDDRSLNVFLKDDDAGLTLHRHPVAQSTDAVRGRVGHTRGLHVWELRWERRYRGTHAVVGVATCAAPLHCTGYRSLVGSTPDSWGWDVCRNRLCHAGSTRHDAVYPAAGSLHERRDTADYQAPDTLLVVLDMDDGTLGFVADGRYLGVAFRGLRGRKLYPIVSAVWGHAEITMKYIGSLDRQFSLSTSFSLAVDLYSALSSVRVAEKEQGSRESCRLRPEVPIAKWGRSS